MNIPALLASPEPLLPTATDDLDTDRAILAQMGFSTFGSLPSKKRKRYNPSADAMTSANAATKDTATGSEAGSMQGGARTNNGGQRRNGKKGGMVTGAGSGANNAPLGERRRAAAVDTEEEKLGGGIGGVAGACAEVFAGGQTEGQNEVVGIDSGGMVGVAVEDVDCGGPGYISSTPSPSRNLETDLSVLKSVTPLTIPAASTVPADDTTAIVDPSHLDGFQHTLPPKPPVGIPYLAQEQITPLSLQKKALQGDVNDDTERGTTRTPLEEWAALRRGVRNERGDMVYFDQSFLEDPWKGLG